MFDKNTLRLMHRELFQGAIGRYQQRMLQSLSRRSSVLLCFAGANRFASAQQIGCTAGGWTEAQAPSPRERHGVVQDQCRRRARGAFGHTHTHVPYSAIQQELHGVTFFCARSGLCARETHFR